MAVYANEDGTVQTLATDSESLSVLYKQYTAKIVSNNSTGTSVSGTGTAAQTFTLPFTPKAVIAVSDDRQSIDSNHYYFKNIVIGKDISIKGDYIGELAPVTSDVYCTLRVNGSTVTITKVSIQKLCTITFDVIFLY